MNNKDCFKTTVLMFNNSIFTSIDKHQPVGVGSTIFVVFISLNLFDGHHLN